jgi:hypothetical protein
MVPATRPFVPFVIPRLSERLCCLIVFEKKKNDRRRESANNRRDDAMFVQQGYCNLGGGETLRAR